MQTNFKIKLNEQSFTNHTIKFGRQIQPSKDWLGVSHARIATYAIRLRNFPYQVPGF